jgi:Mce-associated membrane protein
MPPPRRRPVQPATRVRLPRSARPGSAPAAGAVAAPDTVTGSEDFGTGLVQTEEAPIEDVAQDEEAGTEAATAEVDDPAELDDSLDDDELTEGEADPAAAEHNPLLLPTVLGAAAVTLGSLAIWFGVAASSTGNGVDTQNTALTNAAATAQVNRQVDKAFSTVFSYNYANTAATLQAARTLLTGKAVGEYDSLFKVVEQEAPKEKLVLTTTVTSSGVETLSGNTARVLIFANQQDTNASHQTTDAGAMLAINAVQVNGQWKIASIDAFSSGA